MARSAAFTVPVSTFAVILVLFSVSLPARALTTAYTSSTSFSAALGSLPGAPATLDFDSLSPGTLLASGSTQQGITFSYAVDGLTAVVTNRFDTTSPDNSLGLTGGDDAFFDGDEIQLDFDVPVAALGLFLVSSDPVAPEEIQLVTPVGTALGSGVDEGVLSDGGFVYFLGLVSSDAFSTARIDFADDGEVNFAYNLDDVTRVLPEPGLPLLAGLALVAAGGRRRRSAGRAGSKRSFSR